MDLGKSGLLLILIFGLITLFANFLIPQRFPKLPGDIYINKPDFRFYIPWVSSLILTILASIILNQFLK